MLRSESWASAPSVTPNATRSPAGVETASSLLVPFMTYAENRPSGPTG